MLQEILFGTFVPPEAPTRSHRIGFANVSKYTPPPKRVYVSNRNVKDPTKLAGSKKIIFDLIKKHGTYVSASMIAKEVNMTRNFCSIMMADLCKMKMLTRIKKQANGTRLYVYRVKVEK